MAWTAKLLKATDRDSFWLITVEFSDGVRSASRTYQFSGSSPQELARFVRAKALEFERVDPLDLSPLVGQSIDVTPPTVEPPPDPTPEQLAEQAWFADYRELQAILRVTGAVPALLTPQVQSRIDTLRSSLEAGWQNSYLGDA